MKIVRLFVLLCLAFSVSTCEQAKAPLGVHSPLVLCTASYGTGEAVLNCRPFTEQEFSLANPHRPLFATTTRPPYPPASWTVPEWDFDPGNSSGVASDNNACTSTAAPCLTYSELMQRWTTLSPIFPQTVLIRQMSDQSTNADPISVQVQTKGTGFFTYLGVPTVIQTSTLGTVTAKAGGTPGAPGNPLEIVLGAGLAAGELITNTTRASSTATLDRLVSGTTWVLTQPLSAPTLPPSAFNPYRTEVNTWTAGDSYTVSTLTKSDIVSWQATNLDNNPAGNNGPVLQDVQIIDTGSFSGPLTVRNYSVWQDVSVLRSFNLFINQSVNNGFGMSNVDIANAVSNVIGTNASSNTATLLSFQGGDWRANFLSATVQGIQVGDDTILGNGSNGQWTTLGGRWGFAGTTSSTDGVYLDTGVNWNVTGYGVFSHVGSGVIYGPGTLQVGGSASFQYSGTAVGTFLEAGLRFNQGVTTGCAQSNVTPSVINCGITLNPTNVDAAFGATGFGGIAKSFATGATIQVGQNQ